MQLRDLAAGLPTQEVTPLTPAEERQFQQWIATHQDAPGIAGWDSPDAFYDMRGFWKNQAARGKWKPGQHFPDIYKQHGHPTFSVESKYSMGPLDGGHWEGETFVPPPPMMQGIPQIGTGIPLSAIAETRQQEQDRLRKSGR